MQSRYWSLAMFVCWKKRQKEKKWSKQQNSQNHMLFICSHFYLFVYLKCEGLKRTNVECEEFPRGSVCLMLRQNFTHVQCTCMMTPSVSEWVGECMCVSCKRRHQPWIKSFDIERYTLGICIRCASSLSSNWFPDSGRCIDRMRWTNCQCMGFVMYEDDNAEYVNEIFNGMNENCMWISSQRILSTILDSPFAFSHRKMSMSSHFGIHHFV